MSRIIAGVAGGRRLVMPAGRGTRPTADRVREGLFSSIEALHGPLTGANFLDLYAGSGAVGIEAASRGAEHVTLVERDDKALRAIRRNLHDIRLPGVIVRAQPVERFLTTPPDATYDVVFCDPPYSDSPSAVLSALTVDGWLAGDALVVVERASRDCEVAWPDGFAELRSKRYGDTTLCYGSRS